MPTAPATRALLWGAGILGAGALALSTLRDDKPTGTRKAPPVSGESRWIRPAKAIAVGDPSNPEIDALLREMADEFRSNGADPTQFSPRELTKLRKAQGMPSAIPERSAWPTMARLVRQELMPARRAVGPIRVLNGYRPEDYNEAVGGAENSHHLDGSAADIEPVRDSAKDDLARYFALRYARGAGIGLGIYGKTDPHVHVDLGPRFHWGDTEYWVREVGASVA